MAPTFEYTFHYSRKWRFDLAYGVQEAQSVAFEIQGGVWLPKGGHNTGRGLDKDCEKLLAAALAGWIVVPVTYNMLKSHETIAKIHELLVRVLT